MEDMLMYALKLTVGLVGILIVLRLMGKKELAQITPLDFVYALILGGIIEEALYDATIPVYEMVFSLFYWALLIFVLEKFAMKNRKFKSLTQGDPQILVKDSKLNIKILKKNNMDVDEVLMLLRMQGIFTLSEVKYGILEESGQLSVMQYSQKETPKRADLNLDKKEHSMTYLLVDAGKVEHKRLEEINVDEDWLRAKLKEETGEDLEDIFFAEWNENTGFFIQKTEE